MWREPIYDRTLDDIQNRTSKAYLNATDMNRIEQNIKDIADALGIQTEIKEWGIFDIPLSLDFQRIKNNIENVKAKIGKTYWNYPASPINTFEKVNDIERLIKVMHDDEQFIVSMLAYCGEDVFAGNYLL